MSVHVYTHVYRAVLYVYVYIYFHRPQGLGLQLSQAEYIHLETALGLRHVLGVTTKVHVSALFTRTFYRLYMPKTLESNDCYLILRTF